MVTVSSHMPTIEGTMIVREGRCVRIQHFIAWYNTPGILVELVHDLISDSDIRDGAVDAQHFQTYQILQHFLYALPTHAARECPPQRNQPTNQTHHPTTPYHTHVKQGSCLAENQGTMTFLCVGVRRNTDKTI